MKKIIILAMVCVSAVAGYFIGSYSMFQKIADAKQLANTAAHDRLAELNLRDGESIEMPFHIDELNNVPWSFRAMHRSNFLDTIQKQVGIEYAENYYHNTRSEKRLDALESHNYNEMATVVDAVKVRDPKLFQKIIASLPQ